MSAIGRFLALFLMMSVSFPACMVNLPDTDKAEFACDSDKDCKDGFECHKATGKCTKPGEEPDPSECESDEDCRDGFLCNDDDECVRECETNDDCGDDYICTNDGCKQKPDQDCREVDCADGQLCVEFDGPIYQCEPACVDNGCSEHEACLQDIWGYADGSRTKVSACRACSDCTAEEQCVVVNGSEFFDQVELECKSGVGDCSVNGCPNQDRACVTHTDGTAECFMLCQSLNNCEDHNQTCVRVKGIEKGATKLFDVCKACLPGCTTNQACKIEQSSEVFDEVKLFCDSNGGSCQNDSECATDEVCVRRSDNSTECRRSCRGMADCGDLNFANCAEVDGADNNPKPVCISCNGTTGCQSPPAEMVLCAPSDTVMPVDDAEIAAQCVNVPQRCNNDNECPSKLKCYRLDEAMTGEGICNIPCNDDGTCGKDSMATCAEGYNMQDQGSSSVCIYCQPECTPDNDYYCGTTPGPDYLMNLYWNAWCFPYNPECTTSSDCAQAFCGAYSNNSGGECVSDACQTGGCNDQSVEVCTPIFDIDGGVNDGCINCPMACNLPGEICMAPSNDKYMNAAHAYCDCDQTKCENDLGAGASCVQDDQMGRLICKKTCTSDSDCNGLLCAEIEGTSQGECISTCMNESDCGDSKASNCMNVWGMDGSSHQACVACNYYCGIMGDLCVDTDGGTQYINNHALLCECDRGQCIADGGDRCEWDDFEQRDICKYGGISCSQDGDCSPGELCAHLSDDSGKCIIDCANDPENDCPGSIEEFTCANVWDIPGNSRRGCVSCNPICDYNNGEICMSSNDTYDVDTVNPWCECDYQECQNDMGPSYDCSNGECVYVGSGCTDHSDCGGGGWLCISNSSGSPDGMCLEGCTNFCNDPNADTCMSMWDIYDTSQDVCVQCNPGCNSGDGEMCFSSLTGTRYLDEVSSSFYCECEDTWCATEIGGEFTCMDVGGDLQCQYNGSGCLDDNGCGSSEVCVRNYNGAPDGTCLHDCNISDCLDKNNDTCEYTYDMGDNMRLACIPCSTGCASGDGELCWTNNSTPNYLDQFTSFYCECENAWCQTEMGNNYICVDYGGNLQCEYNGSGCVDNTDCPSGFCIKNDSVSTDGICLDDCSGGPCTNKLTHTCDWAYDINDNQQMACIPCSSSCPGGDGEICYPNAAGPLYLNQFSSFYCECENTQCVSDFDNNYTCIDYAGDLQCEYNGPGCIDNTDCTGGFCIKTSSTSTDGICLDDCSGGPCTNKLTHTCDWTFDINNNQQFVCIACSQSCPGSDGEICYTQDTTPAYLDQITSFACECEDAQCMSDFDNSYICLDSGGGDLVCTDGCYQNADCSTNEFCIRRGAGETLGDCLPNCLAGCNDASFEVCTSGIDMLSNSRNICLTCSPSCNPANGDLCMGDAGPDYYWDLSTWCECDDTQCDSAQGFGHYCDGSIPSVCTNGCATHSDCPTNALCDLYNDPSPICLLDCSAPSPLCTAPDQCVVRDVGGGSYTELCLTDPCSSACDDDCMVVEFEAEAGVCGDSGDNCGTTAGCSDNAGDTCAWDGRVDYIGECKEQCTIGTDCNNWPNDFCAPDFYETDNFQSMGVCIPVPSCGVGCSAGSTCVYADTSYFNQICAHGCQDASECPNPANEYCVPDPRYASPNYPHVGYCRPIATTCIMTDCTVLGNYDLVTNGDLLPSGTGCYCEPSTTFGDYCSAGDSHCSEGQCVYYPDNFSKCMPTCQKSAQICNAHESCVSMVGWDRNSSSGIWTEGQQKVCIDTLDRYEFDEFGFMQTTWFDSAYGRIGDGSAYSLGLAPDYTEGVGAGKDSHYLLAQMSTSMRLYDVGNDGSGFCQLNGETGHIGLGEFDALSKKRHVRALIECPGSSTTTMCAQSGVPPYLYSRRIDLHSVPCDDSTTAFEIRDTQNVAGYVLGAIGEGYVAAVAVYKHYDATEVQKVRVAKLIDNSGKNYQYWAPAEFYLPSGWTVQEIEITRDIVTWIATDSTDYRIYFAPIHTFFDNNFSGAYVSKTTDSARDLVASEHWIAYTTDNGSSQDIEFAPVNLQNVATTPIYAVGVYSPIQTNPEWRLYPALDGHYLAYNDLGATYYMTLKELVADKTHKTYQPANQPWGLPVLFQGWHSVQLWYYDNRGYLEDMEWVNTTIPLWIENFEDENLDTLKNKGWEFKTLNAGSTYTTSAVCGSRSGSYLYVGSPGPSDQNCAKVWTPPVPEMITDMGSGYGATNHRSGKRDYVVEYDICFTDVANISDFIVGKGHAYNPTATRSGNFFVRHSGADLSTNGFNGYKSLFTPAINNWYHIKVIVYDPGAGDDYFYVQGYDELSAPAGNSQSDGFYESLYPEGLPNNAADETPGRIQFGKSGACSLMNSYGGVYIDDVRVSRHIP